MTEEPRVTRVVQGSYVSVELHRSAKVVYYWTLKVQNEDKYAAMRLLHSMDRELRSRYGSATEPPPVHKNQVEENVNLPGD